MEEYVRSMGSSNQSKKSSLENRREKEREYSLKVSAKDDSDQVGFCIMTINVMDINESPYGTITYARTVPENAAVGFQEGQ